MAIPCPSPRKNDIWTMEIQWWPFDLLCTIIILDKSNNFIWYAYIWACFEMTKLTSFRKHLFEDDRQTLFHLFSWLLRVSFKFIQWVMKESIIILRAEINVVFFAFITALIFDTPRKRQNRCHNEIFKLTKQTTVT